MTSHSSPVPLDVFVAPQGLLSGAVGKVGGWFGVVDEAAREEQFKKNLQELVERFPDCPSDLAGRFLTVRSASHTLFPRTSRKTFSRKKNQSQHK